MKYTVWALMGLWVGAFIGYAMGQSAGGQIMLALWPSMSLGAAIGAWCGSLFGLAQVMEPDEQYIATYGCPVLLSLMFVTVVGPLLTPKIYPGPVWSLAYLLAPPLSLGVMSSTVRTRISPLLGLGMLAWVGVMLGCIGSSDGLTGSQLWLPVLGVLAIFLGASAARSALRWNLPKMKGSIRVDRT